MAVAEPDFTLGIEEEYFLVDRATRDVVEDPPPAMLAGQANPELLRSRVEVDRSLCQQLSAGMW